MSATAMATVTGGSAALHSVPKPPIRVFLLVAPRQISYKRTKLSSFPISYGKNPKQSPFLCASSASPTPIAEEEKVEETGSSDSIISLGGCMACGKEVVESGCNGEGRIQGGIATVPGFGWWPIKAYRPCPAFVASGGRYRRIGQSMDEVVSGRAQRAKESQSSKKQEPGKFKM